MAKVRLNQGYYKEALDRCICVSRIIRDVVLTHPVVAQNAQLTHLIQGAYVEIDATAKLLSAKANDNDGVLHDRVFWIMEMVYELLAEHPGIAKDREARLYAKRAADNLWKLYQYLGTKGL